MIPGRRAASSKAIFNYRMRQMARDAMPVGLIRVIQKTPRIKTK